MKLSRDEIGVGQAQVAGRALGDLDDGDEKAIAELDGLVAAQAPGQDRSQLRQAIDRWGHARGGDQLAARERRAWERRRLWVGAADDDGMIPLEGRLDPVGGAHVLAALNALSRPDGPHDQRSLLQRRADALTTVARQALDGGDLPQVAVQRPHVLLVTTAGALHDVCGAAPSRLDGVGAVSAATARQLCCDAQVTGVTVNRNRDVLDAGRSRRAPSPRQRAAVIARDEHCVGCGAAVARCQIHHITWRSAGGATDVDNLCLTCWDCHHHIHQHGWQVQRQPDGRYRALPPPLRHTG